VYALVEDEVEEDQIKPQGRVLGYRWQVQTLKWNIGTVQYLTVSCGFTNLETTRACGCMIKSKFCMFY